MEPVLLSLFKEISQHKELENPGFENYLLVIDLLKNGEYQVNNFESLSLLLEVTWLKSQDQRSLFRQVLQDKKALILEFVEFLLHEAKEVPAAAENEPSLIKTDEQTEPDPKPLDPPLPRIPQKDPGKDKAVETPNKVNESNAAGDLSFSPAGDGAAPDAAFHFTDAVDASLEASKSPYILSNDYFPVKARNLQQAWRSLGTDRFGDDAAEIDIRQTVRETAARGFFTELAYAKKPVSDRRLFILVDRSETMIAVEDFGAEIADAAAESQTGPLQRWYFYQVPEKNAERGDYLVSSEGWLQHVSLRRLFANIPKKDICVLVYSDAGVLQPLYSPDRLENTGTFLKFLHTYAAHVAWINPAPKERWTEHIAEQLQSRYRLAMFDASRRGIENTVAYLKGKKTIRS
jgi:hypothetical protein